MKTYTSKNKAKLSMFFNEGGDFELDKREVITSLRKSTETVAQKAILESQETIEFNKFNDIEKQLENLEEKQPIEPKTEQVDFKNNELEKGIGSIIQPSTPPTVDEKVQIKENTTSKTEQSTKQHVIIEEIYTDNEGNRVSVKSSQGHLVISDDKTVVTIERNIERTLSLDEEVKNQLLSELPDTTTYLASNGRSIFDVEKEKDRLGYEIQSNINRLRYLLNLKQVQKCSNLTPITSFEVDVEAKSTMAYLTVREVADIFFKKILNENYPNLLLDADGIVINISKVDFGKEKYQILPTLQKDVFVVRAKVIIHLGEKQKG